MVILDNYGRELHVGELVSIRNHPELKLKVNWEIICFTDFPFHIEVTVQNFIDGSIAFVPLYDIEKEFN